MYKLKIQKEIKENHNTVTKYIFNSDYLKELKEKVSIEEKKLKVYLEEKEDINEKLSNK